MLTINPQAILQCPRCQGDLLHHQKVEVFERDDDNSKVGTHLSADLFGPNTQITTDRSMKGNPSSHRGAVKIVFLCETCQKKSVLKIEQRTGHTYLRMNWEIGLDDLEVL